MTDELTHTRQLLTLAVQALKAGDMAQARNYAEQASVLSPQIEEPWLLLAYTAQPEQAYEYFRRALQINPQSSRAKAGLAWLNKQASSSQSIPEVILAKDIVTEPLPVPQTVQEFRGRVEPFIYTGPPSQSSLEPNPQKASGSNTQPVKVKKKKNPRFVLAGVAIIMTLILVGWAVSGFTAFGFNRPQKSDDSALERAVQTAVQRSQEEQKTTTPSLTWTVEPSRTIPPTLTSTPAPTRTASPTATSTPQPSATRTATRIPPTPTAVKEISYTVKRGDTLGSIAKQYDISIQLLINANSISNPSSINVGQVLVIPVGGNIPPAPLPTAVVIPAKPNESGKEIHIDISEQHMYAYENGKLVFSYVVSTGIGNSTRIGTFKVLDKIPNAYSSRFNIWMPYWMGIYYSGTLENGIHGLPKLWNGVELWGNLLGQPATYGCIEARTFEIKALYDWAEIGIPVIIRR